MIIYYRSIIIILLFRQTLCYGRGVYVFLKKLLILIVQNSPVDDKFIIFNFNARVEQNFEAGEQC
uniref:Uncharacterized protein n=1 Tax=Wuchereria bancrofti TaxID=6293 RepID=A0AAF5Q372_WUCBA